MQIRVIFAAVAAVAILAGCAAGNDRLRNLNSQQIAEQIVDTQTNRQDVVALLGEPNTTQQEADGTKVLEYTWVRSRPSAKNFIPLNPIDEFPTTKKSLRVWIDDNDRVVKHEYSGVFYVYRKPLIGSNSTHSMRPLTAPASTPYSSCAVPEKCSSTVLRIRRKKLPLTRNNSCSDVHS